MASTGRHGVWAVLDPALPENTRELTEALRARSEQAGRPSFRQLRARSARDDSAVVLTPTTLHRMFTPNPGRAGGNSLPEWTYYETLLRMLGADPAEYSARWEAAQQEWRSRTPTEASPAPDPPSGTEQPVATAPEPAEHVRGRRLRVLTPVTTAIALAVLVVGGSAIGVILARPPDGSPAAKTTQPPTEQQRQPQPDGSDPNATGCVDTDRLTTFYSHLYPHWPVQTGSHSAAVVTLDYSPPCHTVWVVLRNATPGTTATLHRDGQHPTTLTCSAGQDGSCSTAQLNDVGSRSYATASAGQYYARTRTI